MRAGLANVIFSFLIAQSAAAELVIIDARKTLRLSDGDPVYHDYYVAGGSERGLAENQIMTVIRKLPLYDSYEHHSVGSLHLKVAKVKIIHVEHGLSVARLQAEISRENSPLLEDNFILVGDSLEAGGSDEAKNGPGSGSASAVPEAPGSAGALEKPPGKGRAAPQDAPTPVPKTSKAKVSPQTEGRSAKSAAAPVDAPALE